MSEAAEEEPKDYYLEVLSSAEGCCCEVGDILNSSKDFTGKGKARWGAGWEENAENNPQGTEEKPEFGNPAAEGAQVGHRYEGDFVGGERQGNGKYFYPNGDVYDGTWVGNLKEGFGTMQYVEVKPSEDDPDVKPRGGFFTGFWVKDKKGAFKSEMATAIPLALQITEARSGRGDSIGRGFLMYPNGDSYSGHFKDGKKHDTNAVYEYASGGEFAGCWENGECVRGEWRPGFKKRVIMSYKNGFPSGDAVFEDKNTKQQVLGFYKQTTDPEAEVGEDGEAPPPIGAVWETKKCVRVSS